MCIKLSLRKWSRGLTASEVSPSLDEALAHYKEALSDAESAKTDPTLILAALVQRDKVAARLKSEIPSLQVALRLTEMDKCLREIASGPSDADWDNWRRAVSPSLDYWWWWLDEAQLKSSNEGGLPLVLLAGAFMTLSLALAAEIVGRLWGNGPDSLSTVVLVVSLLLTSSPLTKRGRELADWLLDKVLRAKHRSRHTTMLAMAAFAFMLVAGIRILGLPVLALHYNNRGYDHLHAGDLTRSRLDFQRAVALNPDYAEGYYNLATLYEQVADYQSAAELLGKALEADLRFAQAYNNLGRVYILQGEYDPALALLRQGLIAAEDDVTRSALHTNLGRAYYLMDRYAEARVELQTAVGLQGTDAPAHCYLALTYEMIKQPAEATVEWENCLRYADQSTADGGEWAAMAKVHLETLRR